MLFRSSRNRVLVPGAGGNRAQIEESTMLMSVVFSPILYGLVHFLAWSDQFPTPLERLFWQVSSLVMTCSGLVQVSLILSVIWLDDRNKVVDLIRYVLISFIFVVPLGYVLASGFLIVESVRQLFFLDDAAYQLPVWSDYWPHFS